MQCGKCHRDLDPDEPIYRTRFARAYWMGSVCSECRCDPVSLKYERYATEWRAPMPCERCGRPVMIRQRYQPPMHIACSAKCQKDIHNAAYRAKRPRQVSRQPCATCGELFDPARSDAKYCGSACRQRAYRARPAHTIL
jgi:hypothetical protein